MYTLLPNGYRGAKLTVAVAAVRTPGGQAPAFRSARQVRHARQGWRAGEHRCLLPALEFQIQAHDRPVRRLRTTTAISAASHASGHRGGTSRRAAGIKIRRIRRHRQLVLLPQELHHPQTRSADMPRLARRVRRRDQQLFESRFMPQEVQLVGKRRRRRRRRREKGLLRLPLRAHGASRLGHARQDHLLGRQRLPEERRQRALLPARRHLHRARRSHDMGRRPPLQRRSGTSSKRHRRGSGSCVEGKMMSLVWSGSLFLSLFSLLFSLLSSLFLLPLCRIISFPSLSLLSDHLY